MIKLNRNQQTEKKIANIQSKNPNKYKNNRQGNQIFHEIQILIIYTKSQNFPCFFFIKKQLPDYESSESLKQLKKWKKQFWISGGKKTETGKCCFWLENNVEWYKPIELKSTDKNNTLRAIWISNFHGENPKKKWNCPKTETDKAIS